MPPTPTFTVTTPGVDAIPILVEARRRMYEDMGETNAETLDAAGDQFAAWLAERFAEGRVVGYVAEAPDGEWLAAVTAHVQDVPPSLLNPTGVQHYLLGLWVRPEARRQRVATTLVSAAIERAKADGAGAVSLMASDTGRQVYDRLGFEGAPAMRLFFEPMP